MNNAENDHPVQGQSGGNFDENDATRPSLPIMKESMDDTLAVTPVDAARDELDETVAVASLSSEQVPDNSNQPAAPMPPADPPVDELGTEGEDIEDTAPRKAIAPPPAPPAPPAGVDVPTDGKKKPKRGRVVMLGVLLIFVLGALGGLVGYGIALMDRQQAQNSQVAVAAATQFQMGLQDLEAGKYEVARQRFEYVIRLDPNFPGGAEKLAEVMLKMAEQVTPTPAITPTFEPTPTPDTRNEEEIFNQAQAFMRAGDWVNALITLDALRDSNLDFRTLQVDGMYYIALRYRGIDKILKEGNLEGGMYDLALSEQFGPIDKDADGYRTWARLYLTGASFWEVDWERVVFYFSQVAQALPNLRDGTGWTAIERYRIALINFGDKLFLAGDACGARDQYNLALTIGFNDALAATATQAQLVCAPPTATPAPVTATPQVVETTQEPPLEETPSEEPTPAETPTP